MEYGHTHGGSRTNIVYPGGLSVSYEYDSENRLHSVKTSLNGVGKTTAFGYDGASRLTTMAYPNGITGTFGYDAESRVTNIVYGSFIDHTIHRNALGFKTTECIDAGLAPEPPLPLARNLNTHNAADQLTETLRHESGVATNFSFTYNDNGSLTEREKENHLDSISYGYDYNNRLTSVQQGTDETEYLLDASGARVGRIHNSVTNYFVVDQTDGLKRPLAELSIQNSSLIIYHLSLIISRSGHRGQVSTFYNLIYSHHHL